MKTKIYAPCDGVIKPIEELNDGVFSEKMLGEGFYIIPNSDIFYSPIENGSLEQIFDTKHAYFFKASDSINLLMHIGIDTVKLKGKPFEILAKEKINLNITDKIVKVNLDLLKENNISTITPIVADISNNPEIHFKLIKTGEVKYGDVVAEYVVDVKKTIKDDPEIVQPILHKNKFDNAAEQLYSLVGTKANFKEFYNCMTRFRLKIIDKSLVDVEAIKKHEIVKGLVWNDHELQIIIGGDAYKIKDAFSKFISNIELRKDSINKKQKAPFMRKVSGFISGVMIPLIPQGIAVGMIQTLIALLVLMGAIEAIPVGSTWREFESEGYSLISIVFFLIGYSSVALISGLYLIQTAKYLGGDPRVAALLACIVLAPPLFYNQQIDLFTFWGSPIAIKSYHMSMFALWSGGAFYYYIDKWIKKWMPSSVDILFRHLLSIVISALTVFFCIGLITQMIEIILAKMFSIVLNIPFGLNAAFINVIWMVMVVFGSHIVFGAIVFQPLIIGVYTGQSIPFLWSVALTSFAVMGTIFATSLRTKNKELFSQTLSGGITAFFGITEPMVYGVLLPNPKLFLHTLIAGAIGGMVMTMLGADYTMGGSTSGVFMLIKPFAQQNPFEILPEGGISQVDFMNSRALNFLYVLIGIIVTSGSAFLITFLTYSDRKNELKETKKLNHLLVKIQASRTDKKAEEIFNYYQNKFNQLKDLVSKQQLKEIKEIENLFSKYLKVSRKISELNSQEEYLKNKYSLKAYRAADKQKYDKVKYYNEKINSINFSHKTEPLLEKFELLDSQRKEKIKKLEQLQEQYIQLSTNLVEQVSKNSNYDRVNELKNNYYNTIHSLDIFYKFTDPMKITFTRKDIKVLNKN